MIDSIAWRRGGRRPARFLILITLALACLPPWLVGCGGDGPSPPEVTPSSPVAATSGPASQETGGVPADFSLEYHRLWPRTADYAITIGSGGEGRIELHHQRSDPTPDETVFEESFEVAPAELAALFQLMSKRGMFTEEWDEHCPEGGPGEGMTVTAGGQTFEGPNTNCLMGEQEPNVQAVYSAIRALVPPAIVKRFSKAHEASRFFVPPQSVW
jgi:hypothetical protein